MNGPSHYREAEVLLDYIEGAPLQGVVLSEDAEHSIAARAQAHATLALAAATAMNGLDRMDEDDFREWDRVAGVQPGGES